MNWLEHNVLMKTSKYTLDTIIHKNNETWTPSSELKKALEKLIATLGETFSKGQNPALLTVKVNKGGLALRCHAKQDFCWVNINKDNFLVVWNDNLFRDAAAKMKGQDRLEKRYVTRGEDVAAACEFCIRADKVVSM